MFEVLQALGLGSAPELLVFMAAVFVLNATPGVDLMLTVARTLQGGARAGMAAALGINAGCVVHTLAAAFGLAALMAVSATAFTAVKWAGAAYLLWLAFGMCRAAWRGVAAEVMDTQTKPRSLGADFRVGLVTNILNPKVALFFLAFLPQFIAPTTAHKTLAFLGLGVVFLLQSTVFLFAVVALAAQLRHWPSSPRLGRWLNGIGGALFAALAWRLVATRQAGLS